MKQKKNLPPVGKGGARPGAGMPKGYKTRKVRAREAGIRRVLRREELSAERTMEEYARLAYSDIGDYLDKDGNAKGFHDLTADQRAAVSGVEWVMKNATAGDGKIDRVLKFKLWDKVRALESLAKHYRLITETMVEEDAGEWDKRVARLQAARLRGNEGQSSPRKKAGD